MPKPIRFTTLGRVTVNGKPTRQIRPLEAIALLAFHGGWALRETLRAALFGEESPNSSLTSLLTRARRLGFSILEEGGGYRLATRVNLDAQRFEQLLREGRVDEALRLYRGPFMPGARSPFAEEVRTYLEEALIQAVLDGPRKPRWIKEALTRVGPEPRLAEALTNASGSGIFVPLARAQVVGAGLV